MAMRMRERPNIAFVACGLSAGAVHIRDHCVNGRCLVPAAVFWDLAASAARMLTGEQCL